MAPPSPSQSPRGASAQGRPPPADQQATWNLAERMRAHLPAGVPSRLARQNPAQLDALARSLAGTLARHLGNASPRYGYAAVGAGRDEVDCPLLAPHGPTRPNLVLRWNIPPANFSSVDVVVHLHGYSDDRRSLRIASKERVSGLDFADPSNPDNARERPTLGIIPLGRYIGDQPGRNPKAFDFPEVVRAGNLDALIRFALDSFAAQQLQQGAGTLQRDRLILTAHSGGGAPLMQLLGQTDADEVQCFDATYGPSANMTRWALRRLQADAQQLASRPQEQWDAYLRATGGALRVLFRANSDTEAQALETHRALACALRSLPQDARDTLARFYRVEITGVQHNPMPSTFGWQLLRDAAADLSPAPTAPAEPSDAQCPVILRPYAWTPPAPPPEVASSQAYRAPRRRVTRGLDDPGAPSTWEGRIANAESEVAQGFFRHENAMSLVRLNDARADYESAGQLDLHDSHVQRLQAVVNQINAWITDDTQSAISQIRDATRRDHFLNQVSWANERFPTPGQSGGAEATQLFTELAAICPERRVNTGANRITFRNVDAQVIAVPQETRFKLYPHACSAYVDARGAAAGVGVTLRIGSAWRSRAQQQQLQQQNNNPNAVAQGISTHNYGLAADLLLSTESLRIREMAARDAPLTNLISMYRSPVYKWMFINGETYGYYPYRMEPWHWEYNPPGFKARFEAGET